MNPEEKQLLEKTYEIEKENNHILKGIRSSNRWNNFFKIFYWILIIGISVGAFYFVEPYVNKLLDTYKGIQGDFQGVKSVVDKVSNKTGL